MMQLGLTGFYYDYTDMQIGKIVNRTAVNENVDSAIWGVELETVISPTILEGLRLDFNLSWLGSEIQNGQSIDGANPTDGRTGWMPIKQLLPFPAGQNAVCNPAINTTPGFPFMLIPAACPPMRSIISSWTILTINSPGLTELRTFLVPSA